MSLEAKITLLTAAVEALTLAIHNSTVAGVAVRTLADVDAAVERIANTAAPVVEPPEFNEQLKEADPDPVPNESSSPESGSQSEQTAAQSSLTYDDVKRATNNLSAAKGKEITIAALAHFGVKRATELTEAQWPEYCSYTADCATGKIDPREAA